MKFRLKITICTVWILSLAFGLGGSFLIASNFSDSFDKEADVAVSDFQITVKTLQLMDITGFEPDHSTLKSTLDQISLKKLSNCSAMRLISNGSVIYEMGSLYSENPTALSTPGAPEGLSIVQDLSGGRYIRICRELYTAQEIIQFEQCYSLSDIFAQRDRQVRTYQVVFLVIAAVSGFLCWVMSYWLTRPLRLLSAASRRIAAGDLTCRAQAHSMDEFGELIKDFNTMADTLENNFHTIRDTSARQERFMANFAHELKNPMTSIIGYADLLRTQALTQPEQLEAADYIFSEGKRLESLSLKLLNILMLKEGRAELTPASLAQLIQTTVDSLRRIYAESGISLRYECQDGLCFLEPDLVKSLLINLLDNARKAMDDGGTIQIISKMFPDGCQILVQDDGRGIPEEKLDHITDAFYRVDKSRSREQGGVGLGLTLCLEIARLHHGSIHFESTPGRGTCVTVELRGGTA